MPGKTCAIVQAHRGSQRLPDKILLEVETRPMLWHVIHRLKQCKCLDDIIIAMSDVDINEPIVDLAKEMRVSYSIGSEHDVLDRYFKAASRFSVGTIVRVTSDCPLIDPALVDACIEYYNSNQYDYAVIDTTVNYPDGFDTEVFSYDVLKEAWLNARDGDREHVTTYIKRQAKQIGIFPGDKACNIKFSVDTTKDLTRVRRVFRLVRGKTFGVDEVLNLVKTGKIK